MDATFDFSGVVDDDGRYTPGTPQLRKKLDRKKVHKLQSDVSCCVVLQPNCHTGRPFWGELGRVGASWVAMPLWEEWRIESGAMSHG